MDHREAEHGLVVGDFVDLELVLEETLVVGRPIILVLLVDHSVDEHVVSLEAVAAQADWAELEG